MRSDYETRVLELVAARACVEPTVLRPETLLLAEGYLDSFGILQLAHGIEREFGLELTHHDLVPENWDSIAHIADFLSTRL